jgi:Family of unknown function (DUF6526)
MPWHHFVVQPILIANFIVELWRLMDTQTPYNAWRVVVAFALLLLSVTARSMALKAQDRVIRLEERIRLARLLPASDQGSIESMPARHLIALRFASDEEVPDLVRRINSGELTSSADIKKNIRNWRPDYLRV